VRGRPCARRGADHAGPGRASAAACRADAARARRATSRRRSRDASRHGDAPRATPRPDVYTSLGGVSVPTADIASLRPRTSDAASLFSDTPGMSIYAAGGISGLPANRGLADDRLRIKVDGMDLLASCPAT
jgi:hypothetical protein